MRTFIRGLFGFILAAIFSFGFTFSPAIAGEAEDNFTKTLVANSPWQQKWETFSSSGTVELSFSISEDGNLAGKLFNFRSANSSADTPIKDISVKGSEVRFVNVRSGTAFKYRLNSDGTMSGTFQGTSSWGNDFEGTMKAAPASGTKN